MLLNRFNCTAVLNRKQGGANDAAVAIGLGGEEVAADERKENDDGWSK